MGKACCSTCLLERGRGCPSKQRSVVRFNPIDRIPRYPPTSVLSGPIPPMGFFGGSDTPKAASGSDIAEWVLPDHRPLAAMVFSLSTKRLKEVDGYILQPDTYQSLRVGVWFNTIKNHIVVGLRGTQLGGKGGMQDLKDDGVVSGILSGGSCDLGIVKEAMTIMDKLRTSPLKTSKITVSGFSLGGSAAMCIGNKLPYVKVVSFAGGAPPTQPTLVGPGPNRATHYHVVGDLVSTHMSPAAARVVRVDKGFKDFSVVQPHVSDRFLRTDWPATRVDAEQEDKLFMAWAKGESRGAMGQVKSWVKKGLISLLPIPLRTVAATVTNQVDASFVRVAESSPIPGSQRFTLTRGDPYLIASGLQDEEDDNEDEEEEEEGEVL